MTRSVQTSRGAANTYHSEAPSRVEVWLWFDPAAAEANVEGGMVFVEMKLQESRYSK